MLERVHPFFSSSIVVASLLSSSSARRAAMCVVSTSTLKTNLSYSRQCSLKSSIALLTPFRSISQVPHRSASFAGTSSLMTPSSSIRSSFPGRIEYLRLILCGMTIRPFEPTFTCILLPRPARVDMYYLVKRLPWIAGCACPHSYPEPQALLPLPALTRGAVPLPHEHSPLFNLNPLC